MKLIFLLLLAVGLLHSEELGDLLGTYTHNSDLSNKTKLESGGAVTIFTRKDLDIMQAHSLKDILKSHPIVRYKESRGGIADMFYRGSSAFFSSSTIRLYIDNQELVSSTFGSGFTAANSIDLDFIDHVEIYTRSPSYEFSTEPTYILIKLYSKTAERDSGGKLNLNYGSRGFNQESAYYADELKDYSYVAYVSRSDDKRKKYFSHNIPIKRDSETYSLFSSIHSKNNKLQVMAGTSDLDTSIARSPLATYDISTGHYDYFNIGYETTYFKNLCISVNHQYTHISGKNKEAAGFESPYSPELDFDREEGVSTAEIKYTGESEYNRLIIGAKLRYKTFEMIEAKVDGVLSSKDDYNRQAVSTIFLEDRHSISNNNIISIAAQYALVNNNGGIENEDLFQFRINHTYIHDNFIFKSFAYRVESLVEPYIYVDFPFTKRPLDNQVLNAISEEIKYINGKNEIELVATYGVTKNLFVQPPFVVNPTGAFTNSKENVKNISAFLEYTYNFDIDNKLVSNVSYADIRNFNNKSIAAFVRSLNRVGKFDIFNEVIFNRNNIDDTNHYDYSAGIKYSYTNDLIISLKGENIFNKGYEDSYYRVDPNTFLQEEPINISPVEQRFFVSMEYMF
ncbi:TonB-dependent receptor plug domain-containing protein [Candidatus Sulfurimonas marisnigri]|uniref:TonB-dependent receptor plug domain-containing protein n=1 Tax=Candidatus Sulfurimonas marisnigri TaxID=2740405 RepID=A0A7S7RRG5_9BACT|nr:TonB-dependent receptor [Candidatus Sulfurimonas marisnigri]QOY55739.1 TonB-dependent receptor plug domain-containing protein [Candidatus Sulfurimonas marisnigri]